jgi:mannose-P-dolichol utilization defect protein 1
MSPPIEYLHKFKQFVTPKCYREIFEKGNFMNMPCNKLLLSKVLSIGIIVGATVVKVPQILKILNSGSVVGLSALSYVLESFVSLIITVYNYRHANPFSTYGESLFLTVQNLVILGLIWLHRRRFGSLLLMSLAVGAFAWYFLVKNMRDIKQPLATLQASTIPVLVLSRLPQIYVIFKNGHSGQLSAVTVFLLAAGSIARVFTTLQEVNDKIIITGAVSAAITNSILLLQVLYYWNSKPKEIKKD